MNPTISVLCRTCLAPLVLGVGIGLAPSAGAVQLTVSITGALDRSVISAGGNHTCAVTPTGGVRCWGANDYGQVGDGSTIGRTSPVNVVGLAGGVVAVSAGSLHTCALTAVGGVQCWGSNEFGQLGDNTTARRLTPVSVAGLASGAVAVSAGLRHSCALTAAGGVKCWGGNQVGALGNGTQTDSLKPVDVTGLASGVIAVSAGLFHTCALTASGGTKCWGGNQFGQLGDGTTQDRLTPVQVAGLAGGVAMISTRGWHSCAQTTSGGAKCWGANDSGQLGDGSVTARLAPADVTGFASGVAAISAGSFHTCALTTAGGARCWGRNVDGEVGDGTTSPRTTPMDVTGLTSVVAAMSAGGLHTCALTTAGNVRCWGGNNAGQLGIDPVNQPLTPVELPGLTLTYSRVASAPAGLPCATTCATALDRGTVVNLTPLPGPNQVFAGWSGWCSGTGACAVTVDADKWVTATFDLAFNANVRSVVASFYQSILGRAPDPQGVEYWAGEATRIVGLGPAVREVFFSMAMAYFGSAEYAGRNTSDPQYITDLYRTFFNREPDAGGLAYWLAELGAIGSRSALLDNFLFSAEFSDRLNALFGASTVRPEVNMTMDLYRGTFARLPDSDGFNFWLAGIRGAQCAGASVVSSKVNEVANLFYASSEYGARARNDRDFVGDVYGAYLRRGPGGDSGGFNFWVGRLPVQGRDGVRAQFVPAAEFQARVAAVVNAGCLQ